MKSYRKAFVMSLALLGPVAVIAEPAQTGPESGMVEQGPEVPRGEHGKRFIEERMAELHKELKLTATQEADWNTWSAKIKEIQEKKRQSRPDWEVMKSLPAPERLEKMIDFSKQKQAHLEDVLAATKTFYATLTPEQRKVFDDLTPFGKRAHKWKHHGGPRHPGPK
ncbi:Spy/CpxP family protein refolding chaperone [Methylocaldum sp. MU1018]